MRLHRRVLRRILPWIHREKAQNGEEIQVYHDFGYRFKLDFVFVYECLSVYVVGGFVIYRYVFLWIHSNAHHNSFNSIRCADFISSWRSAKCGTFDNFWDARSSNL